MLEGVRQAVGSLGLGGEAEVPVDDGALGFSDGDSEARPLGAVLENGEPPANVELVQEFPVFRVFCKSSILQDSDLSSIFLAVLTLGLDQPIN